MVENFPSFQDNTNSFRNFSTDISYMGLPA